MKRLGDSGVLIAGLVPLAAWCAARLATGPSAVLALGGAVGLLFAVAVLVSAHARAIALVAGSLLVFQSTSESAKAAYLALIALCLVVAVRRLLRDPPDAPTRRATNLILASGSALAVYVVASLAVARANGAATTDWVRDSLAYFMIAALPIIGIEIGRQVSAAWLSRFTVISGVVATIGFSIDWLSRRGALEGASRIVLSTTVLVLLVFAYSLVSAATGTRRIRWGALTAVIAATALLSGTRTYLVLFTLIALATIGRRRSFRIPPVRLILSGAAVSLMAAIAINGVSSSLLSDDDFLAGRVGKLDQVLNGALTQDQSFQEREESYAEARANWEAAPWFGHGPGRVYATTASGSGKVYTLDTPWMVPAKLGLIGTLLVLAHLTSVALAALRLLPRPSPLRTTLLAWMVGLIALTPFGPWVEDKGLGPCMLLILGVAAATARERGVPSEASAITPAIPQAQRTRVDRGDCPISSGAVRGTGS